MRSIDGVSYQQQPTSNAATAVIQAVPNRQRPYKAARSKKTEQHFWAKLISRLYIPCIFLGAIACGLVAIRSSLFGQLSVVAYGLISLVWRISSRVTFSLALIYVIATAVLLVGGGQVALAQNFATMTFLFLVVGVINLGREIKQEGGRVYSRKRH